MRRIPLLVTALVLLMPGAARADDLAPPVVHSIDVAPSPVDVTGGAQQVTVTAHLSDDVAIDVQDTHASLRLPGSGDMGVVHPLVLQSGTLQDGVWTATFDVPANTPTGDYAVGVLAEDTAVNDTGAEGTPLHVISAIPAPDVVRPVVHSVVVDPGSVDVTAGAREVTVRAHLSDDHAIDSVDTYAMLYLPGSGPMGVVQTLVLESGTLQDGVWSTTYTIPATTPTGDYAVSIVAEDTGVNDTGAAATPLHVVGKPSQAPPAVREEPQAPPAGKEEPVVGPRIEVPGAPQAAAPTAPADDRTTPVASVRARGTSISVSTTCTSACRVTSELRLGNKVLARAARRLQQAGRATVELSLSRSTRRRLRAAGRTKPVVRITVTDAAGRQRTVTQPLKLT